jgi:hypothetical protein
MPVISLRLATTGPLGRDHLVEIVEGALHLGRAGRAGRLIDGIRRRRRDVPHELLDGGL